MLFYDTNLSIQTLIVISPCLSVANPGLSEKGKQIVKLKLELQAGTGTGDIILLKKLHHWCTTMAI